MLREGEYIGHEVYFPDHDVPQSTIDLLRAYGFCQSSDGFYIPIESLDIFKTLSCPYKVGIMQSNIILEKDTPEQREHIMNQLLDMINKLKVAGVHGVDNFIQKIKENDI